MTGRKRGRTAVLVGLGAVVLVVVAVAVAGLGSSGGASAGRPSIATAEPEIAMERDASTSSGEASGSAAVPDAPAQGVPVGGVQRALVRTAQLTVEVEDPAGAARQARTAAAGAGGFVTEEQSGDTGSWLVLRVPADALDRLMADIAAFGHVAARSTQTLDATEEVVDLDARVASQQASVARIRALLAEAESIGDVVAIESELATREAELDSLTRRLEMLRDQVALSTLTVDLRAPGGPQVTDPPAPGFLDGLASGWEGLRAIGSVAAAAVGFLVPFLPALAVLGGIAWLVRRAVRRRRVSGDGPVADGET
ncbi:DUF4349 domain-containing protein [Pseudonocardia nigra]|uniref:DUF4349 domain-containing protein n=1 Tax=Pseudonocardia nigra TaxID=1921578 RepID=UPI001C5FB150|nr:DUF4349 domain-containing protein [Pseudonocardia nigra]